MGEFKTDYPLFYDLYSKIAKIYPNFPSEATMAVSALRHCMHDGGLQPEEIEDGFRRADAALLEGQAEELTRRG